MGAAALGAMTIALVLWGEPARAALNQVLGMTSWEVAGRRATGKALGLLALIALILALDPEARVFLLFINDVGVDIFLLLLTLQGRGYLLVLGKSVLLPAVRRLANWGWYPMA